MLFRTNLPKQPEKEKEWGDSAGESSDGEDEDSKTIPVFTGTPRLLLFNCSLIKGQNTTYPVMQAITNATFSYHLIARPDIRSVCYFWEQNAFIGPDDKIPGITEIWHLLEF